jgi:putative oxidoreductase
MKLLLAYRWLNSILRGPVVDSLVLLFVRVVFAGIFWRSGATKVVEGSWFRVSDGTYEMFATDFSGIPLEPFLAANLANVAEHVFPLLLVLGLATRVSAGALLVMTMAIQIFVFPDAWWPMHSLWVALALVLIARGPGLVSFDAAIFNRLAANLPREVTR